MSRWKESTGCSRAEKRATTTNRAQRRRQKRSHPTQFRIILCCVVLYFVSVHRTNRVHWNLISTTTSNNNVAEMEQQLQTPIVNPPTTIRSALDQISKYHDDGEQQQPSSNNSTSTAPGGLIFTSYFSFSQDPRHIGKYEHKKPTFENIYHFWTTVVHYQLHALIFTDDQTFDKDFIQRFHKPPYIQFVIVNPEEYFTLQNDKDEFLPSPIDFRLVLFDAIVQQYSTILERYYDWFMISDVDVFFNRNPFPILSQLNRDRGAILVGSFDGGSWADEKTRLQRKQLRACYGYSLLRTFGDTENQTPNGNCGLWAGTLSAVQCVLRCSSQQYHKPTVRNFNGKKLCDMAVHDYCVHFGGCWKNSTPGVYDTQKQGVIWGPDTMHINGKNGEDLFGPPYARRHHKCLQDSWAVVHNRCDTPYKPAICFNTTATKADGSLSKYHQHGVGFAKKCKLDNVTFLPLPALPLPT